jgi:hypothetical protein
MVSEYAQGHYNRVLSLTFVAWAVSSWALACTLWAQVATMGGKLGLLCLLVAGLGQSLASVFDITHPIGHSIAGLLGVGGFAVAAPLLTRSLGRDPAWAEIKKRLLWISHFNWVSVVLLGLSLVLMTLQVMHALGGKLPTQAPTQLPPGVIGLDGWAERLIVLTSYVWIVTAAGWTIRLQAKQRK